MAANPLLSQGTSVYWLSHGVEPDPETNVLANITRVAIGGGGDNGSGPEVSVAHLGSCHCQEEPFLKTWAAPSNSGNNNNTIQIDFMDESPFVGDEIKDFHIQGKHTLSYEKCTCISVQMTAQTGDVLRGSATIRFA